MMKIVDNAVWRDGQKIGWVEGHHVFAHGGKKLGYFEGNDIYGEDGRKIAYVEGDRLFSGDSSVPLEKISESIQGGITPGIDKCAIYVLLGD